MIKIINAQLEGVRVIKIFPFHDFRGKYVETYNEKEYIEAGINIKFIQDDYSISHKDILRGLHGDNETWKLVSCPLGSFILAVINFDRNSKQYLKWETFELNEENHMQVLIPPKFANGHLVLSDRAMFNYKQSTYYVPNQQFSLRWNDPKIGIKWPIINPILSERDKSAQMLF